MRINKILAIIVLPFLFFAPGCAENLNKDEILKQASTIQENIVKRSYVDILKSGVQPGIKPDYAFPKGYQYENGCFGFAIKYIVEYKFGETLDMLQAEKIIKKPRYELWTLNYIKDFLEEYGIVLNWYHDSEKFFKFLEEGEPLLIQYKYPVAENRWISHFVAVYSFDLEGVWISQSVTNKHEKVLYKDVFKPDGMTTQFMFATVETFNPKTLEIETPATPNIN